jgi:hypothetical protein
MILYAWGLWIVARDGRQGFLQRQPQVYGVTTNNPHWIDLVATEAEVETKLRFKIAKTPGLDRAYPRRCLIPGELQIPDQEYKDGMILPSVIQFLPYLHRDQNTHSCPSCSEVMRQTDRCPWCGTRPIRIVYTERVCGACGYVGNWPPKTLSCVCGGLLEAP